MKRSSHTFALPIVTTTGQDSTPSVDVSSCPLGAFYMQFTGIAGGGTYIVEGSIDEGQTWIDVTVDMGSVPSFGASTSPLTADGMLVFGLFLAFAGDIRVRCTNPGTGSPKVVIAFQDSRQE